MLHSCRVHCRVGSLEMADELGRYDNTVHCRVGSLEMLRG